MFGSFRDVTAEEFLFVQNDLSKFRKSWDSSTKQLSLVEENETSSGHSSVYYWEATWPRFFSNRNYCSHRSAQADPLSSTTACVSAFHIPKEKLYLDKAVNLVDRLLTAIKHREFPTIPHDHPGGPG